MKRRLLSRRTAVNLEELALQVQEEWNDIAQGAIRPLIDSMPNRCAEVLRVRGGHTHY